MKLQIQRAQATSAVFIIVSISSAVYVTAASINYLSFFPALAKLDSRVVKVAFLHGSNGGNLSATVTVDNPTDYSGFAVSDINIKLYLNRPNASTAMNQTLFMDQPLFGYRQLNSDLGPHSEMVSSVYFSLSSQQFVSVSDFNRTYYGQIFAHVSLVVDIFTFLYSATGYTTLLASQDVPFL
jgi:hypothetical protein